MRAIYENLLAGYAKSIGLAAEPLLAQQPANLTFDDKINIQIALDEASGDVCFSSWLYSVEEEKHLAMVALMIAVANFEQDGLSGAHLAMNTEGKVVLLHRIALRSLDNVIFDKRVKEFVDAAEKWTESVASLIAFGAEDHLEDTDEWLHQDKV